MINVVLLLCCIYCKPVDTESLRPSPKFQINIKIQLNTAYFSRLSLHFLLLCLRWLKLGYKIHQVAWPFDYVVTWQMQKPYICTSAITMTTNSAEWQLTVGRPHPLNHVTFWSSGHVTNGKPYNCISTTPIASQSGRVVT